MATSEIKSYRDLADEIDRRSMQRQAVARVMGLSPEALSRTFNNDPFGTPSADFIAHVMGAIDALARGEVVQR